ncbi:MAG: M42 family metallopeptidase [Brevinema sp.]
MIKEQQHRLAQDIMTLSALSAPSYREESAIRYLVARFKELNLKPEVDHSGNISVLFPSQQKNASSLMIFAHSDEIGFVVRKIEKNGFLRVERIGGVHRNTLHGQTLQFLVDDKEPVLGVIGVKSHHYTKENEKGVNSSVENLYVDIGVFSAEEARSRGISVGTTGTFFAHPRQQGDLIIGKAMDDRAACGLLLAFAETLKNQKLNWDIIITISVQEEFNIRGIMPAVHTYKPSAALGIDITPSCDTPELQAYSDVGLGKGPAITAMNFHGRGTLAGMIPDQTMVKFLKEAAINKNISVQDEVALGVLTETAYISFSQSGGVPCCGLSIPTRYSHTPIETIHLKDLYQMHDLLEGFVQRLPLEMCFGKSYLAK